MTYLCLWKTPTGWRWNAMRGGRIIACSGEAYKERRKAQESLDNLLASVANGSVRFKKGSQ
jgi:uncharacterized protein YegP (UPF0339 family)